MLERGCKQGAQLEPQLGSPKFLLVILELLVSSHVIMVSSLLSAVQLSKVLNLTLTVDAKPMQVRA